MIRFNHVCCPRCWSSTHDHPPFRVLDAPLEKCCWCGELTGAGIYVRQNPDHVPCLGEHGDEERPE